MVFLNVLLLICTIFILYLGYTYKAFFFFIFGLLFEEISQFFTTIQMPKMVYDNETQSFQLKFLLDEKEYCLMIPKEQISNFQRNKILALSKSINMTERVEKIMGPCGNFFGSAITPKHLNLPHLFLWQEHVQYKFGPNDPIQFTTRYSILKDVSSDEEELDDGGIDTVE